jgi:hypothetical protein
MARPQKFDCVVIRKNALISLGFLIWVTELKVIITVAWHELVIKVISS